MLCKLCRSQVHQFLKPLAFKSFHFLQTEKSRLQASNFLYREHDLQEAGRWDYCMSVPTVQTWYLSSDVWHCIFILTTPVDLEYAWDSVKQLTCEKQKKIFSCELITLSFLHQNVRVSPNHCRDLQSKSFFLFCSYNHWNADCTH